MKLSDFILLNEEEKRSAVLAEGVLVAKRDTSLFMVFLFQLKEYYVETYCSLESKCIREFRIFTGTDALQPYLEAIHIDGLFINEL